MGSGHRMCIQTTGEGPGQEALSNGGVCLHPGRERGSGAISKDAHPGERGQGLRDTHPRRGDSAAPAPVGPTSPGVGAEQGEAGVSDARKLSAPPSLTSGAQELFAYNIFSTRSQSKAQFTRWREGCGKASGALSPERLKGEGWALHWAISAEHLPFPGGRAARPPAPTLGTGYQVGTRQVQGRGPSVHGYFGEA